LYAGYDPAGGFLRRPKARFARPGLQKSDTATRETSRNPYFRVFTPQRRLFSHRLAAIVPCPARHGKPADDALI
jgi:hypothetical protein